MAQIVRPRIGHGVLLDKAAFHGRKFDSCGAAVKWSSTPAERTRGINTAHYGGPNTNGLRDFEPDTTEEDRKTLAKIRRAADELQKFWRTMKAEPSTLTAPRLVLRNGNKMLPGGKMIKVAGYIGTRGTPLESGVKIYTRDKAKEAKELGL